MSAKLFFIEDTLLTEKTIEKYSENLRDAAYAADAAQKIYFKATYDFISIQLIKKRIVYGSKIVIDFADGASTVQFSRVFESQIEYRNFNKKGKLLKSIYTTHWTMWKHITKAKEAKK